MNIILTISVDETNAILQTLGKLPTESGAYPLLVKIKNQADEQVAANQTQQAA